jgi:hypothetical protein
MGTIQQVQLDPIALLCTGYDFALVRIKSVKIDICNSVCFLFFFTLTIQMALKSFTKIRKGEDNNQ